MVITCPHCGECIEADADAEHALAAAVDERDALRAEVDRLRMKAGQQQARCAVFMAAMAWLARHGEQDRAQQWVARADAAALDVRPEDFVVATPCGGVNP